MPVGGSSEEFEMDDDFYTKNEKGEYVMKIIHTGSDMMEDESIALARHSLDAGDKLFNHYLI